MSHIKPRTDEDLLMYCQDESDVIRDLLPGNYEPTPDQWLEIAAEIIRTIGRFRHLKSNAPDYDALRPDAMEIIRDIIESAQELKIPEGLGEFSRNPLAEYQKGYAMGYMAGVNNIVSSLRYIVDTNDMLDDVEEAHYEMTKWRYELGDL